MQRVGQVAYNDMLMCVQGTSRRRLGEDGAALNNCADREKENCPATRRLHCRYSSSSSLQFLQDGRLFDAMALINFAKLSVRLQTSHFSKNFTSVHSSRVVVNSVSCSLIGTSPKCPTSCYAVSPVLTMASTAGTSPTRRHFHSPTSNLRREIDRRSLIASAPRVDVGTQGEKIHDIDYLIEE